MDRIDVLNPATRENVGSVIAATPSEIAQAVDRARSAQRKWAVLPFRERAAIVARFHDGILERSGPILDTIQKETAKTRRDALAEVISVAGTAQYAWHMENPYWLRKRVEARFR